MSRTEWVNAGARAIRKIDPDAVVFADADAVIAAVEPLIRAQIAADLEAMRQDALDMHGEDDEPYYATVSQTLDAVLDVVRGKS